MYIFNSAKLYVLGPVIEIFRFCEWAFLLEDFVTNQCPLLDYSIMAQFDEGYPSHEWIDLFLVCLSLICCISVVTT